MRQLARAVFRVRAVALTTVLWGGGQGCGGSGSATGTGEGGRPTSAAGDRAGQQLPAAAAGKDSGSRNGRAAEKQIESSEPRPPLRFSGVPDSDKDKLSKLYAAVSGYLSAELGREVEYVHVPDYTAAVTALAANKVDLVWLGGVTAVQAEQRTGGQVDFVATRAADLHFKTYFVAQRQHVANGVFKAVSPDRTPMPLPELAAMKPDFARMTLTFGSKNSTSGHIMPRYFMQRDDVDIDPETDLKSPAAFQLKGGHSATLRAVASGASDLGALNYTTWERADDQSKLDAPVIYVTPEYVDYVMVAHRRLGADTIAQLRGALVALDVRNSAHATVLEAFGARTFVRADPKAWDGIRGVLDELERKGVLK
ncbi:MAG: PhnD/SsuA/transferrin family substrate-binding protein [Nannocystaceae bacterium]